VRGSGVRGPGGRGGRVVRAAVSGVIWAGACGMGRNERGEGGSERRELGSCGKRVGLGFGLI